MALIMPLARPRPARELRQSPGIMEQLNGLDLDLRHPLDEPCRLCQNAELASAARRLAAIIKRIDEEGRS